MKTKFYQKVLSVLLCLAILSTYLPVSAMAAQASADQITRVSDESTMDSWKDFFLPAGKISTENAGGVWVDKSVFTDDAVFSASGIAMDNSNAFLVALSAMAANMTVTGMAYAPTDTMLILDVSASMGSGHNDVAEELVEAANTSIESLLSMNSHNRVGVVLYSGPTEVGGSATASDAVLILPLGRYETNNDIYLNFSQNRVSLSSNVVYEGTSSKPEAARKSVTGGTYIQKGVMLAASQLTADGLETTFTDPVLGTVQRKPVMVLMSDGAPTFSSTNYRNPTTINLGDGTATSAAQGFVNQLTAAYAKNLIEAKYGASGLFYTIGLGVDSDAVALSVLDPDNTNASTAINDFWTLWDAAAVGNSVTVQSGGGQNNRRTVTKIAGLEQNYVDDFINVTGTNGGASLGDQLKEAFEDIVRSIKLQSEYVPTLVSHVGEDHSGFITFIDKIGEYMQVTDIKGILINDRLYSGADMASNFVPGGGNLGVFDNPTALGHEMVAAVRERIGLESDDAAKTLIGLAYEYGQLYYNSETDFSNYIGWYADRNSKFLGFYQEGVTNITDPDAVYTVKSYGYLGVEHDSNMMYATVQVRHNIQTGEETVAFAIPAALIPIMTYEVTLDSAGSLVDIETIGAESPIRLVYEVALDDHINEWNVNELVSPDYLADPHNVNPDGTVNFYTNAWEHTNSTGYNTVNTYSYFNPSRQNEKYYYTSNAPVYADAQGTLYTGSSAPYVNGAFYRAYTVYEESGILRTKKTVYRRLSAEALGTAVQTAGTNNWHIPSGNVHVDLVADTRVKGNNETATLSVANQPFVDVYGHNVNDLDHIFYVGSTLGNNGKLTLEQQTGIKISKTMANGSSDETFTFVLTKANASSSVHDALLVSADGTETAKTVEFDGRGKATVNIKAGQTLYIGDLSAGDVVTVNEAEMIGYIPSVTVNGVAVGNAATVTVEANRLTDVDFVNTDRGVGNLTVAKEVEHDFGVEYQIPADKRFTLQVTLSGIGTANATFAAEHTDGTYTEIVTDANGRFTVQLKHDEQLKVFGLPAGTVASVVETQIGTGFTPTYWDNGALGDGRVTVMRDATVSVIVVNDYQPTAVSPVNLNLGGEKIVRNVNNEIVTDWDAAWNFTVVLERYGENGWTEIDRKTVDKDNKSFAFDMSTEVYDATGVYSYQLYEIEPAVGAQDYVEGMVYDLVCHTFSVYVSDPDMDGDLDIVRIHSDHANKDFEPVGGIYNVKTDFENVQTVTVPAHATFEIQKLLENRTGSALVSLAGYNFGLYTDVACTVPAAVGNGVQYISLNPTDAVGEGWIDIRFDQIGQYVFYVKEIAGVINGMTYSENVVKVVVDVTVHPTRANVLVAEVSYQNPDGSAYNLNADGEMEYTNVYSPTNATLSVDFVSKKLVGRAFAPSDNFTFEMVEINVPAGRTPHQTLTGIANTDSDGDGIAEVTFSDVLTFSQVGTYVFDISETSPDGNGVTTDRTVYVVVVTVADNNGVLEADYSVVNVVGNAIVFENSYKPADVTYAISGSKNLIGRTLLNDEFTFVLTEALNADGDIAVGAKTYETHNEFGGVFTFPEITYTQAGTYYYVVSEKQSSGSSYGIHYDTAEYVVTVTVTDDTATGQLVASANLHRDDIVFTNRYIANPVSQHVNGTKIFNGKALGAGRFSFELWQSNAEWGYVNAQPIRTVTNDVDGSFTFDFVDYTNNNASDFTKTGRYYFLIKEVNGGQTIEGVTYDDMVYRVMVEVTDDLIGQLHATVHIYDDAGVPQQSIVFINSYEVTGDADLILDGTKKLNGRIPADRVFEFELYEADEEYAVIGNYIQKVTQDADGNFRFVIRYEPDDISDVPYRYVVKEANGGQTVNGVTFDNAEYHIEVMVEDDGEGGVKTTAVIRKGEVVVQSIDFANTYKADSVGIVFGGEKLLEGSRELKANDFTFEIYNADEHFAVGSGAAPAVKNGADGKFEFAQITFDAAKTYYFVVKENSENPLNGVTYDASVYHITVKVTDNERLGKLQIESVTYLRVQGETSAAAEGIVFENSYNAANVTVSVGGTKVLENRTLAENEFKFFLYAADETYAVDETAAVKTAKNKADGGFTFDAITFDRVGTYYYVIVEDPDTTAERVTNDTAVYYLAIEIKDDFNGKLYEASRVIKKAGSDDAVEEIVFTNIFTPKPADITVDIGVVKTVVNKGAESIGPEGFEFVLDALAESVKDIKVTSDESGKAEFTLSFTEADIGKTYTYKLTEVNGGKEHVSYSTAEYTVAVTISLNEDNELVAAVSVNGEAVAEAVAEFENVYDYTPTPEEDPEESEDAEEPDNPKTGDGASLQLLLGLMMVSGGGLFGTALGGRKSKKEHN